MADPRSAEKRLPLLCRLFGHKWTACHRVHPVMPDGRLEWVYVDDVCLRCSTTEYRKLAGDSRQDRFPIRKAT